MLLDRLQSGFLLFETPQGLVRADLSPRQRIYLLWTFRNFRQLSLPLLNARQRELVNTLFRHNAGVVPSMDTRYVPVIGVVENFVPPAEVTVSPAELPVQTKRQQEHVAPKPAPVEAKVVSSPKPAPVEVKAVSIPQPEPVEVKVASIPRPAPVEVKVVSILKRVPAVDWSKFVASGLANVKLATSGLRKFKFATAVTALTLCVFSVLAWHQTEVISASEAQPRHEQPSQLSDINTPQAASPAVVAENSANAVPVAASTAPMAAAPRENIIQASIDTVAPVRIPAHIRNAAPAKTHEMTHEVGRHKPAASPKLPLDGLHSAIQASRPPQRWAYPATPEGGARGKVALTAVVGADGSVQSVRVISGNRGLAAAAVRAVRQWRYRPYIKDGQPIATETNIVFSFFSDDAISMSFPPGIAAAR